MSRPGWNGQPAAGSASSASLSAGLTLLVALLVGPTPARAQQFMTAQPQPAELAPSGPQVVDAAGVAVTGPAPPTGEPAEPLLPPDVQVVRFQVPAGSSIEVLGPPPVPVPHTETPATLTVGLKRGVGYRLRLANIPEREGVELFPVIEVIGHLHRPATINPAKYPIRVILNLDDIDAVLNQSRLLTKVLYLEDPDQALPVRLPKDQIPVVSISPTENPLRVAAALGRPMAIIRLGGRRPTIEEVQGGPGDFGLDNAARMGASPCPYLLQDGSRCPMVAGPPCTAPKPKVQSLLPGDEFLCDGGDRGMPIQPANDGRIGGVEPRDAAVRFDIGLGPLVKPRTLPTNVVCIYAPRFAEVRVTTGTNQTVDVQHLTTNVIREGTQTTRIAAGSRRLVQNQTPEMSRNRERPSGFKGRISTDEESNRRVVGGYENLVQVSSNRQKQSPELARNRQQASLAKKRIRLQGIKTAEAPVVTGITEGASQAVRVWGPHQMTGVETPPNRPGLAVIKRVSAVEAEPGDTVTYVIHYRNMGNTPIRSVVIVDSLLPRLEYVKGTARGPAGTAFGSSFNRVGSTELRWALPGVLAPGASGQVSFNVIVR